MLFRVTSDSSCDITPEQEQAYHIGIVPYYVSFDGEEYRKERQEISVEAFYKQMVENPHVFPKTSLPTVEDFEAVFRPILEAGEPLVYFNLTSKFSSSFQLANMVAEGLREEFPHAKIAVIDSISATVQQGLLVLEAARMAQDGLSFEEAVEKIEKLKKTSCIFYTTADLSYLQKGGRIGKLLKTAAIALKIKPLIHLHNGELFPDGIARSRKRSLQKIMERAIAFFADKNPDDYRVCIGYGYDKAEAQAFLAEFSQAMADIGFTGQVEAYQIGVSIGVHNGPAPLGISMIRKYDA